jgi:hypothetical protein
MGLDVGAGGMEKEGRWGWGHGEEFTVLVSEGEGNRVYLLWALQGVAGTEVHTVMVTEDTVLSRSPPSARTASTDMLTNPRRSSSLFSIWLGECLN